MQETQVWFMGQKILWRRESLPTSIFLPGESHEQSNLTGSPILGFSRQQHWSGLPFASPMHESEEWKWSRLVVSDSVRPQTAAGTGDSPGKNTGVGCHFLLQCMKVKSESDVAQPCQSLRDLMDCSLPGSSVHGTLQARVLKWGAIAFSIECNCHLLNDLGLSWFFSSMLI